MKTFLITISTLALATVACAFPRPAEKKAEVQPCPLIGTWTIDWGGIGQTTTFAADGGCESPEYGRGTWNADLKEGKWVVVFGEDGDECQYIMIIDLEKHSGSGASISDHIEVETMVYVEVERQ